MSAKRELRSSRKAPRESEGSPTGTRRFSVEEDGGLMYGSVVFVWPEGDARERYNGSVVYALAFWDRLMGREASEAEKQRYGRKTG